MDISWLALLRTLHIIAAGLWFGAAMFGTLFLAPAIGAAGDHGRGFMAAVQQRGGFARFMGPAALTTLATGLLLYWQYGYHRAPFATLSSVLLTVGALAALSGWVFAMATNGPLQRRLAATAAAIGSGGPTPKQANTMTRLQGTITRNGRILTATIATAFLLMAGRNVVT